MSDDEVQAVVIFTTTEVRPEARPSGSAHQRRVTRQRRLQRFRREIKRLKREILGR